MDRAVYARMADVETSHWWFAGRRAILATLVDRVLKGRSAPRILEAGCGSGGNLGMLARFGRLEAFEYDAEARAAASARSGFPVVFGALPDEVPHADGSFDLVALFDVLEHIDDDVGSLRSLGAKLKDDGRLLITVPALPWLWSEHDVVHHHKRRYTRRSLEAAVRDAGLEAETIGWFNTLLFPLALLNRLAKILTGRGGPDDALPAEPLNRALHRVFAFERHLVGRVPMPIGLSLYAVVRRPSGAGRKASP